MADDILTLVPKTAQEKDLLTAALDEQEKLADDPVRRRLQLHIAKTHKTRFDDYLSVGFSEEQAISLLKGAGFLD